jgi:hypothetical protein
MYNKNTKFLTPQLNFFTVRASKLIVYVIINMSKKYLQMNRNLSIILPFLSVCTFVLSCSSEAYFDIGTNWVDTNLKLVYVDSCKAKLSTIKIDSIPTYNQSVILVGKYEDLNTVTREALTGTIKSTSYIEVSNPSVSSLDLSANTFFDSLVVEMRFNGFYMGDTLKPMHLFIHQLQERIKREDAVINTEMYYNTTSFRYNPTPLAEIIFPIRPNNTASGIFMDGGIAVGPVRVKLPDTLGKEMFDKIANKDKEFDNSENFLDYFKGLVFVAGDDVGTIIGIKADTTFKINMYYHIQEEFKTEKVLTFSINAKNQFNNIVSDRTGTNLLPDKFNEDNEIDSHNTGNQSFIMGGNGLYTKIEFPNLSDILLTSTYGIVEQAILEIRPVYGTYQEFTTIPPSLTISATTLSGELESALSDSQGKSQTGNLIVDEQFPDNTRYTFDVTSFVQNQMLATVNQKLYLTLRLSDNDMQKSIQRLVIGDSDHAIETGGITYYNRIKLYLYYNMYNEKN